MLCFHEVLHTINWVANLGHDTKSHVFYIFLLRLLALSSQIQMVVVTVAYKRSNDGVVKLAFTGRRARSIL